MVRQSGSVRIAPAVTALVLAAVILCLAGWLLVVELMRGRSGPGVLFACVLGGTAFVVIAWAVGRIRRTRAITPEAIISSSESLRAPD